MDDKRSYNVAHVGLSHESYCTNYGTCVKSMWALFVTLIIQMYKISPVSIFLSKFFI